MVNFKKYGLLAVSSLSSSNVSTVLVYPSFKAKQGQNIKKVVKKIFEVENR